ncbi:MAG: acetoacetate decarboxylase family protein [Ferrovibrionaceae bacterium]
MNPPFVSWAGHAQVSLPAPGVFEDTLTSYFFVPANPANTQSLVDKLLNAAPGGAVRYDVFGAYAMVVFMSTGKMTTPSEPFGWIPYREASIWLPLIERRKGHLPRFVAWMPYVFPDATIPMVCGREGAGFNKSLGRIRLPVDGGPEPRHVCETMVFKEMSSDCRGEFTTLFSVSGSGERGGLWSSMKDLVDGVRGGFPSHRNGLLTDLALLLSSIESLVTGTVEIVDLMQFRDPRDNTRACYQAIVDCTMKVDRFRGAWPLHGPWTVQVADFASHQVITDFGFPADGTVPVDLALQIHMDFSCPSGEVVWQA